MEKVKVGSKIPMFTLKNQGGKDFRISDLIGKKNMVIYFYPKNETAGCTRQACSFRDEYEKFADAGAVVIGISNDDPGSHRAFSANHRLPFTLLSDEKNELRKAFGVPDQFLGLIPGRVTYIADKKGIVRHIFNSQIQVTRHVEEALKALHRVNNEPNHQR